MASWDFPAVAAPPTSAYGPPVVNFAPIANLVNDYYKGQQERRTEDQATAFRNGIPKDASGTPDYGAMSQKMLQLGDYPVASQLQQTGIQLQQMRNAGGLGSLIGPQGAGAPGATASPAGSSVAPVQPVGGGPAPTPQGQPATVMTILAAQGIPNAQLGAAAAAVSRQLGVGPTDTIDVNDPQVRNVLGPAIGWLKKNGIGQTVQPAAPVGPGTGVAPVAPVPVPNDRVAQGFQAAQPQSVPSSVQAIDSNAPQQPLAPIAPQAAQALESKLDAMPVEQRKAFLNQLATSPAFPKSVNEWAEKRSEALEKASEPTPEQKNAAASGMSVLDFQRSQEEQKQDVERFGKQAQGIEASAAAATSMIPHLQLARSLMNQPNFYSGTGEGINLAYKRAIAAFGGDPNASLPQEGFRKVMAANILDQVAQLKAETAASGGSTRIFQSQIALMEKAAQNPDNSIAANRLLTEMGFRAAERAQKIADMASNYNGGHLNPQFNVKLRQWNADHPMFTPQEMADPRLIAPPEFKTPKAAFEAKLPKGTPLKIGGQLKWVQ